MGAPQPGMGSSKVGGLLQNFFKFFSSLYKIFGVI
jgi:hypothetical protein